MSESAVICCRYILIFLNRCPGNSPATALYLASASSSITLRLRGHDQTRKCCCRFLNWMTHDVFAYGPKTGPVFLHFLRCDMLGGWGGNNVLGLRFLRLALGHVFCPLVDTLHVTLDTSSVLRSCWTRLLYFGGCTSSYVGHVFCPQVGLKRKEVLALWRNAYPSRKRNFFEGVQHTCFSSHCNKAEIFGRSQ